MIRAAGLAILLASAAKADTPLVPEGDWRITPFADLAVEGTLVPPRITVYPPAGDPWSLEFWVRSSTVHPSPDGQYLLLSPASGNLLGWSGDPDETVLWLFQSPGGEEIATVPLRALIRPRDMQRTVSHYVWITGYTWSENGWRFETPDGRNWHLGTDLRLSRH